MNIKKYKATTENEAILMAKEDLGPEAIVLNIKTIKPKGLFKLFKKSSVELTAAVDENIISNPKTKTEINKPEADKKREESVEFGKGFAKDSSDEEDQKAQSAIEEKINILSKLLEQQMTATEKPEEKNIALSGSTGDEGKADIHNEEKSASNSNKIVELIKAKLIENEVSEKNIDSILEEVNNIDEKQPLDNVLANIYQKIVLKLGEIKPLKVGENKPKIVFFVGNTGVGKTTTMAKLASKYKLEDKMNVAMVSVDTYRIAAIDQMKTYAGILNVPGEVVYTPEEMKNLVEKYKDYDLIFVDTAGRSHKNEEQKNDLNSIIESVEDYEKEIYLVLSVATKYKDLLNIAETYGELFDYKLIFTKLDETKEIGTILNLKLDTGKDLSYVTWGQNVPDDIGVVNPQIIAKKLLGGAD